MNFARVTTLSFLAAAAWAVVCARLNVDDLAFLAGLGMVWVAVFVAIVVDVNER